ncbi:MAG TPA: hypothetical protein VKV27_04860 [Solirubrobacteraceae bacterium]|nr:hypothetical protein [Solirubrobacteraceae bacterium]
MASAIERHELGLTWVEERGLRRAAHALADGGRVWLVDPFEDEVALAAACELGRPAAVLQLLDRHERDCGRLAQRLEVAHLRLPSVLPDSPLTVVRVIWRRWWHELALWWEDRQALIVAEALGTAPVMALGRRVGLHPLLRLSPPRAALTVHRAERLLVGHGRPLHAGASDAIAEALGAARTDLPRLARALPGLLRDR